MEGDKLLKYFDKLLKYSLRIEILRTKDERIKKEVWLGLNDPAFIKGLFSVHKWTGWLEIAFYKYVQ